MDQDQRRLLLRRADREGPQVLVPAGFSFALFADGDALLRVFDPPNAATEATDQAHYWLRAALPADMRPGRHPLGRAVQPGASNAPGPWPR